MAETDVAEGGLFYKETFGKAGGSLHRKLKPPIDPDDERIATQQAMPQRTAAGILIDDCTTEMLNQATEDYSFPDAVFLANE